jgi:hypothetical protein
VSDQPAGGDDVLATTLVDAACKGSSLVWITVGAAPARPAWHEWSDGRSYVVHARDADAAREQVVPGLADADQVDVSVRGDKQGRVVTWRARVTHLDPGSAAWEEAVALLRPKRLNETDPDGVAERWAQTCHICALEPTGELVERPGSYDSRAGSAPPPPSPATTVTAKPYVLGRRTRRRPHL